MIFHMLQQKHCVISHTSNFILALKVSHDSDSNYFFPLSTWD